jgi:2-iminobutanoate/2-iminopropanoate deaminase
VSLTVIAPASAKTLGPYSPAIVSDGLVFCSGQIPLDPASGQLIDGSIAEQTQQALTNLAEVLEAAGSSLSKVLKTTVYLVDLGDFAEMNAAYADAFGAHKPARVTLETKALPMAARIEIDCIATQG